MISHLLNFNKRGTYYLETHANVAFCQKITAYRQRKWPDQSLKNSRFVVFDTETTGLFPYKEDKIISVGGVVLNQGQVTEKTFLQLVNPYRTIPPLATELTGITNEMVANAPDFIRVGHDFLDFADSSMLIAHHGVFDFSFINVQLRKICGEKLRAPYLDTHLLSHFLFPNRQNHSLDCLANTYGVPLTNRHTALGDSLITSQIFLAMVEDLKNRGISTTEELLISLKYRHIV